jgi:hypothetical protein
VTNGPNFDFRGYQRLVSAIQGHSPQAEKPDGPRDQAQIVTNRQINGITDRRSYVA